MGFGGLGDSAPVAASHIIMIVIIAMTAFRLLRLQSAARPDVVGAWLFPGPIAMVISAFGIERSYYVAARVLKSRGYDLWTMHPAPDILSAVVALSCYWIVSAVFRAQGMPRNEVRIAVAVEATSFVVIGLALAALLR